MPQYLLRDDNYYVYYTIAAHKSTIIHREINSILSTSKAKHYTDEEL